MVAVAIMTSHAAASFAGSSTEVADAGLRMEAAANRDTLLLGEPLVISIRFTNVSDEEFVIEGPIRQAASEYCIWIALHQHGTGASYRPSTGFYSDRAIGVPHTLSPGSSIESVFLVGGSVGGPRAWKALNLDNKPQDMWAMPVEGTYEISIRYVPYVEFRTVHTGGFWKGTLETEPLTVVVRQPGSARELAALEIWRGALVGLSRLGVSSHPPKVPLVTQSCMRLVEEYRDTEYAPYALYLLARFQQPDAIARADYFRDFIELFPSSPMIGRIKYELAETLFRIGSGGESALADAVSNNRNEVARSEEPDDAW